MTFHERPLWIEQVARWQSVQATRASLWLWSSIHMHTHMHTHSLTHSLVHMHAHSLSHTCTLIYTCSLSPFVPLIHTHTIKLYCMKNPVKEWLRTNELEKLEAINWRTQQLLFVRVPLGVPVHGHLSWDSLQGTMKRSQTYLWDFVASFRHEIVRGILLWTGWESGREPDHTTSLVSLAFFTLEH